MSESCFWCNYCNFSLINQRNRRLTIGYFFFPIYQEILIFLNIRWLFQVFRDIYGWDCWLHVCDVFFSLVVKVTDGYEIRNTRRRDHVSFMGGSWEGTPDFAYFGLFLIVHELEHLLIRESRGFEIAFWNYRDSRRNSITGSHNAASWGYNFFKFRDQFVALSWWLYNGRHSFFLFPEEATLPSHNQCID